VRTQEMTRKEAREAVEECRKIKETLNKVKGEIG
jgi:hypothetical protein